MIRDLIATEEEIRAWQTHPLDKLFVSIEFDKNKMYCERCEKEIIEGYKSFPWLQTGTTKKFKQCIRQHGIATWHVFCFKLATHERAKRERHIKSKKHTKEYLHSYYLEVIKPKRAE